MPKRRNRQEDEARELRGDPRVGKRVICRALLPAITLLGTIQRIVRYANGVEYWNVLTDGPMTEEAPASSFVLYEGPEFEAGQRVKHRLDGSGYWEATVLQPQWTIDHLRFIIRVDSDVHGSVKVERGHEFAADPGKLTKL